MHDQKEASDPYLQKVAARAQRYPQEIQYDPKLCFRAEVRLKD